ncbi:MAG TPA: thrombospondin type 3 repeat-containing protein [Thermoanaerobaculia bacterium]
MNVSRRNVWLVVLGAALALYAIYLVARPAGDEPAAAAAPARRANVVAPTGGPIDPIHVEWLEPKSGSYRSSRNLFAFVEPPPPPIVVPPPPPPPPDRDKDGVPDYQDNCPDAANPDQSDVDRNGIGTVCQEGAEVPPPPPPPTPPAFPYRFIGTFGSPERPIAVFSSNGELVNVRPGETFGGKFILLGLGIESADIGYVGFPPDVRKRIPIGE